MNDIEMILRSRIEELERRLLESQARVHAAEAYVQALEEVCDSEQLKCAQSSARQQGNADYATAAQRAEAYLKTIGKWEDSQQGGAK